MEANMSEGGRIVVSASLREKYGFSIGDTLVCYDDEDGLRLSSRREGVRRARQMLAQYIR